jgi:ketosteroid isomerase-like protein
MKLAALIVLAAAAIPGAAAQDASARRCLEEMNRDVWMPFMEGVRRDDESLYLRVRSKDYVRVASSDRFILGHADYVDDTVKMMRRYREQGTRLTIDVRFEERICDGRSASDKGISRVLFTAKDGTVRTYFGRFHTISRKEADAWRVLTDYFPPGNDVGEEQFTRARAVGDIADFLCYMTYPDKKLRCDS